MDITDTFSYGCGAELWNIRCLGESGVPDYINEAAFALDSAYAMIVERFGFHPPLNAPDPNGNTDYYTVVINKQPRYYYGVTQLGGRETPSNRGFNSYIEINSDWSGPDWWSPDDNVNYNKNPYNALRVTAAHELFHAVQYAMSWDVRNYVLLDDFPYSWTEGSAVLMEDIAFPEVKDYLQYFIGYFNDPTITMLNDDDYIYLNSILFKFLYERTKPASDMAFIREMYYNSSADGNTRFHENLERVSKNQTGKTWPEVLNGFHAESYFSGNRAQKGKFITDSERMRNWQIPQPAPAHLTKRTVKPYGAEFFWYTPQKNSHPDDLKINFSGQTDPAVSATWALSALVMEQNGNVDIVSIPVDKNGRGLFTLEEWYNKNGILLIATNGSPNRVREITIEIDPPVPVNIFPNTVKLRDGKPINITGTGISDVKIYTLDGKLAGCWNNSSKNENFITTHKDTVKWIPKSAGGKRLSPGMYYITASSKKSSKKAKIMILP